jgi:hypothetical protein
MTCTGSGKWSGFLSRRWSMQIKHGSARRLRRLGKAPHVYDGKQCPEHIGRNIQHAVVLVSRRLMRHSGEYSLKARLRYRLARNRPVYVASRSSGQSW